MDACDAQRPPEQSSAHIDYKDKCKTCSEVERKYKVQSSQEHIFIIHTTRTAVKGNKRCDHKKTTLQRIEKVASALRNTEGGVLLVHIEGQWEDDRCLEHFDELISKRLHDLIENGQLYVNLFERFWLSKIPDFKHYKDIVFLKVKKSSGPATVDFNTKLRSDNENISPVTQHIKALLTKGKAKVISRAQLRDLPVKDVQLFQEQRSIELKAFKPSTLGEESYVSDVVKYIWEDLRFKDNLTSLSKVPEGGSYYAGVAELKYSHVDYATKVPFFHGIELKVDPNDIIKELREKISSSTVAYDTHLGFIKTPDDLVEVKFHRLPVETPNLFVLEVAVRCFDGIVFSDPQGPRAYKIQDDVIKRIEKEEWIARLINNGSL